MVSLSTAESEFYGIVRGAASGIQLREAFMQFVFTVRLRVLSDSSAARAVTARTGSGRVKHGETRYLWVQDRVRKKQFSVGSIDTSHNTADMGTKFHSGERLRELMRMMRIVVGEFEPTKLPKKLLGGLFLASQVTQVHGDDDSVVVTQHEEKCAEGCVCLFGFVSGVLAIVLIRFVADCRFGSRCAKPPVIHVEVGRQVDLLAYDEELVDDLNSWMIQSELLALAGLFVRLSEFRLERLIVKEVAQTGLVSGYVGAPGTACAC